MENEILGRIFQYSLDKFLMAEPNGPHGRKNDGYNSIVSGVQYRFK